MGSTKRGVASGLLVGGIMAIYSNITSCHPTILGGGVEACVNSFQLLVGVLEFLMYFPLAAFAGSVGIPLEGEAGFRLLITLSPLLFFGVLGSMIGLIINSLERK